MNTILVILKRLQSRLNKGIEIDLKPVNKKLEEIEKRLKEDFGEIHNDIKGEIFGFEPVVVETRTALGTSLNIILNIIPGETAATSANWVI